MEKTERRFLPLNLKIEKREDGPTKIVGYAAVFNSLSENLGGFREKIKPGAFKNALKISDTRALFNHDRNFVLGRQSAGTLKLKEDKTGLHIEIDPPDTSFARDLMVSIGRGDITQQSFGFTVKKDEWKDLDGEEPLRTLTEIAELFDVSPVTFPAYPDTNVAVRSLEAAKDDKTKKPDLAFTPVSETADNTRSAEITIKVEVNGKPIGEEIRIADTETEPIKTEADETVTTSESESTTTETRTDDETVIETAETEPGPKDKDIETPAITAREKRLNDKADAFWAKHKDDKETT